MKILSTYPPHSPSSSEDNTDDQEIESKVVQVQETQAPMRQNWRMLVRLERTLPLLTCRIHLKSLYPLNHLRCLLLNSRDTPVCEIHTMMDQCKPFLGKNREKKFCPTLVQEFYATYKVKLNRNHPKGNLWKGGDPITSLTVSEVWVKISPHTIFRLLNGPYFQPPRRLITIQKKCEE